MKLTVGLPADDDVTRSILASIRNSNHSWKSHRGYGCLRHTTVHPDGTSTSNIVINPYIELHRPKLCKDLGCSLQSDSRRAWGRALLEGLAKSASVGAEQNREGHEEAIVTEMIGVESSVERHVYSGELVRELISKCVEGVKRRIGI